MRKQSFVAIVMVLAVSTMMFFLLAIILNTAPNIQSSAQAATADVITPTVTAIDPSSAFNDLNASVVITGTNFTAELSGSLVLTSPTAYLGNNALMDVTWVNSTALTATVPWDLEPGAYTLTVINPDGGMGSLTNAFTVTQGIGQWNSGDIFGGEVRYVQLKPGDPNTVYALAYQVGLFRSRDAGENWSFIWDKLLGNTKFVIDPLHPSWLYYYLRPSLYRSQDEGDTWIQLINTWPDGRGIGVGQVYPSPHDDQVLFLSSSADPGAPPTYAYGLIKSTDGGLSWDIVADMEGIHVQDVDFHPTDPLQMVLATQEGLVFQSTDGGDTWSAVNKPPLSNISSITYNPYKPIDIEVWVTLSGAGGIYKSTDADFTWLDVTPVGNYVMELVKFTSADSVYTIQHHSTDGGLTWQQFGPSTGYGEMSFNPDNTQIGYIGDESFGVQKTLDGGQTWEIKNQGLTGLTAFQMDTSSVDPRRVFALLGISPGVYRSDDGANSWTFLPFEDFCVEAVRIDPFNSQYIYAVTNAGFYTSTNEGLSWTNLGWNWSIPGPWEGGPATMEPDPYQPGHFLVGFNFTSENISRLLSSSDYGVSWQPITVTEEADLAIASIVFHPETPGLVYLISPGTGVYQSTDHGNTWERIDDLQQPEMALALNITIATHPQPMLLVGTGAWYPYRSMDGGTTWERVQNSPGGARALMFLNGDSSRLYAATWSGLLFSSDAGNTWERAAGVIGEVNISALDYAVDVENNYTILYAATNGGDQGGTLSMVVDPKPGSYTAENNLVEAGIYRYVQHIRQIFLPLVLR